MNWEFFVGLRYLRARRRENFVSVITVISTLSVFLGVMVLTIVLSVMTGFEEELRDRILGLHPHLRVSDRLGGGVIKNPNEIAEIVAEDPSVVSAHPVVTTQMLVSTGDQFSGVIVRGVEPDLEASLSGIADYIRFGDAARLGGRHRAVPTADEIESGDLPTDVFLPGIMIGAELGRRMGIALGHAVTVMVPTIGASPLGPLPRSKRFIVVAIYDSGMVEYDAGLVYMGISDAQAMLKMADVANGVEVVVDEPYQAPKIAARLNEKLGLPFWVQSWTDVHRNVFEALALEKTVYFLVLLLIILVSSFTIISALYMVVMEKRRDIAVLKSIGATDRSISAIFIFKGLLIGVFGTLLGVLAGYLACVALDRYEFIRLPAGVFPVSTLPVRIVPENFIVVAVASILICLGACLFPAWKASKVVPVDVLRYE